MYGVTRLSDYPAGARLKMNGMCWAVRHTCLMMTLFFTESKEELQRVVDEFHSVCMRRKLNVNVHMSKTEGPRRRRSVIRWKNRMKEWTREA